MIANLCRGDELHNNVSYEQAAQLQLLSAITSTTSEYSRSTKHIRPSFVVLCQVYSFVGFVPGD